MPTETNDEDNIDKLLAELKNESSEVSEVPKKDENLHKKPIWADKKNDESNEYEYTEKDVADDDW